MRVHGRDDVVRRRAEFRLFGQAAPQQRAQVVRHPREVGPLVHHPVQRGRLGPGPERRHTPGHVHGECAEREDVGGGGDGQAQSLFRCHVRGGPDAQPGAGEAGGVGRAGDPEVDDTRTVLGDEDVGGLEIPVDDPRAVDRLERLGDTGDQQQHRARRERTVALDRLGEGGPRNVGGGEPGHRIVHPGIDHLGGEQSVDTPGAGDLVGEPQPESGVRREVLPHRLQHDGPPAPEVGEVHHAHAPGAQPGVEAVAADLLRITGRQRWAEGVCPGGRSGHALTLSAVRKGRTGRTGGIRRETWAHLTGGTIVHLTKVSVNTPSAPPGIPGRRPMRRSTR